MDSEKQGSVKRGTYIASPIEGEGIDKVSPLLKYEKPFLGPDSFNEITLILQNNTEQRLEGWLKIVPPSDWTIEPGDTLMIAIRSQKFTTAEFYLSVPEVPTTDSHLLKIEVISDEGVVSAATFDIGSGLLYVVDN